MNTYVFEQQWQGELDRLRSLESIYDGNSVAVLAGRGVDAGWTCLEVGGGAGSMARWLADRVGGTGRVVATDLDPRFLAGHDRDNLDVWTHDILTGPLDPDSFDLIHARAVLEHVARPEEALRRMVTAVRPGGWIVLEDADFDATMAPAMVALGDQGEFADLYRRCLAATATLLRAAGADPGFGCKLPHALRAAGLVDVGAQFYGPVARGAGPTGFIHLTVMELRGRLVEHGLLGDAEIQRFLDLCAAGASYAPPVVVSAWGRRPFSL
jgi:ubiquinone/menaquinone biosynthesis C-methylase UbiE